MRDKIAGQRHLGEVPATSTTDSLPRIQRPARPRSRGAGPRRALVECRMPPTPVPNEERIGERDLAEWHTRTGRWFVALVARVVALLARGWHWSLANLALVITVLVGGVVVLGATVLA